MLKTAYQIGVQQALAEEDIETLVKEAQELGIDLEKLAIPLLGNLAKAMLTGAKTVGKGALKAGRGVVGAGKALGTGVSRGMAGGQGLLSSVGRGLRGAGGQLRGTWKGLSGLQRGALLGGGGVAAASPFIS